MESNNPPVVEIKIVSDEKKEIEKKEDSPRLEISHTTKSETPDLIVKKEKKVLELVDILKIFAPGTSIRLAIDDIQNAGLGALIVLDIENLFEIVEGGFKVNCKFSPQRLVELSKMDGAIILSEDMRKILYANTMLVPNIGVSTKETGTRHKAAERTAKQFGTIVIAISERKNKITLYYNDIKYVLEDTSEILRRATETLNLLEKQKELFDDLLLNLNVLEMTNLVNISDICNILQRLEIIKRISAMVKRYLIELGKEGIVFSMRLKELTKNLAKERELLLKDYFGTKFLKISAILENMNFDFLLETSNISRMLFEEVHDRTISPKGIRMLSRTNLLEKNKKILMSNFKTLDELLNADEEALLKVLKRKDVVDFFKEELKEVREKIMTGKKI